MRILKPLFIVAILAGIIFAVYYYLIFPNVQGKAKLLTMTDPDSLIVMEGDEIKRVQLIGVDAPELTGPYLSEQCYHAQARKEAAEFFKKEREIKLVADPKMGEKDVYDRELRYVTLLDGTSYNEYLLSHGIGKEAHPEDSDYDKRESFKSLEESAQSEGLGIWNTEGCDGKF